MTKLAVKIRAGSLWDREVKDLGELGFFVSPAYLLRNNTGAFSTEYGWWVDNPLPAPMIFTLTTNRGEPQKNVRVVAAP